MNILLLACPPTPEIEELVEFGEKITGALGGKVTALCVRSEIAQKFYSPFSIQLGEVDEDEEERVFRRISQVSGDVKKLRRGGEFVSQVLDEIERGGYDMLIFGDIDRKVTKKLAEYSHIPTLICRKKGEISRFLVCTDGSEHSEDGVRLAGKFAGILGAKVTVLSVARTAEERPQAENALKGAREILAGLNVSEVEEKLVEGARIRDSILAEEEEHDVVVIGPRGLNKLQRAVFGHVSLHVLDKSECNVLMVW